MSHSPLTVKERIQSLREALRQNDLHAYLVPSSDPHGSEYVAPHWRSREWISGFTGSAGTAVITLDKAGLWTDGRYFIQAEQELEGTGIELFKMGNPGVPSPSHWLKDQLQEGQTLAMDGKTIHLKFAEELKKNFRKKNIQIQWNVDLIHELWKDRPELPQNPVTEHPLKYAGASRKEKFAKVREAMKQDDVDLQVIGALDDIAWLFNYRGADIDHTPVSYAFATIDHQNASLYIQESKLGKDLLQSLKDDDVIIKPYDSIYEDVKNIPHACSLQVDPLYTNPVLAESWQNTCPHLTSKHSTPTQLKCQKNETEVKNYQDCMKVDGLAMVKFLHWLDEEVPKGHVTEMSAEDRVDGFRAESELFMDTSFKTISAYASNGAMMHYSASPEQHAPIKNKGLYLVDSGGQYPFGTTDLTRTISFGATTEQERRDYTLVLKAMINLSLARFRKGVSGVSLDTIARNILWQEGLDYNSGTGHGVGICLSVHEGPASISPRPNPSPIELNMFLTNEPGIYRQGAHGIRIENILRVVPDECNDFGEFYKFETLTLAPICKRPIDSSLLSKKEIRWLNDYHQRVYDALAPLCEAQQIQWLKDATSPLS